MCAGAIMHSGIENVYFGAYDIKYGACISTDNIFSRFSAIKKVNTFGGIMEDECSSIIKNYFREMRQQNENAEKETQR